MQICRSNPGLNKAVKNVMVLTLLENMLYFGFFIDLFRCLPDAPRGDLLLSYS